jgi:hypothetical protein
MTLIIGIGNKARQGKDYVANYMQEALPSSVCIYNFARELKLYCKEHHYELLPAWQFAHTTKQMPGHKEDPIYGYAPILQWVGVEKRKENPDYWVEKVAAKIAEVNPEIAVIADVRFPNEAAYVKENGGYTVNVSRRLPDGTQMLDTSRDPNHISEIALSDYEFDYYISVQDRDLGSLKRNAILVLNLILREEAAKELNAPRIDTVYSDATGSY